MINVDINNNITLKYSPGFTFFNYYPPQYSISSLVNIDNMAMEKISFAEPVDRQTDSLSIL